VEAAACLLAFGADHRVADREGRTPLGSDHVRPEVLHAIRQRYQRFPTHEGARGDVPPQTHRLAEEFSARGILRLPGFINPDALSRMKAGFSRFVGELDEQFARGEGIKQHYDEELHWAPDDHAYLSNNAFRYSSDMVAFCLDETLLDILNICMGKPAVIQRAVAARYLPAESPDKRAFRWHHDMEEKRLKAMVLLTDIGEHDQYMSYVVGSHTIYHAYEMFFRNTCTLEYCREHVGDIEIANTIGQAGDVFLFDSNGAHRGVRRADGAVRDVFFIEFAANRAQVWGGDIDRAVVEAHLPPGRSNPFEAMLVVQKKWTRPRIRTGPTWIHTLTDVDKWL
jgi:hypothetical protein